MNISGSIRRLTNVFLILFVALSAGLVYWQVVVAQQVASNKYLTYTRQCTSDNAPIRGSIYDRNGVLLAHSVPSTKSNLCGYQRIYTPAAKGLEGLIGYYISPLYGSTGVEKQFNDYLNGKNGVTGLDNTVNHVLHVPPHGDDIYLTIDSRVEKILVKNFPTEAPIDNNLTYRTDRGSIIVSDPTTGEILGILSEPGYDPNCIVTCSLNLLRTDMLTKGYNKTIGCASPCSMDQFKTALDNEKARLMAKLGPGCENFSDCTIGSTCEDQANCNAIYLRYLNSDPARPLIFRPTQDCYPPGSTYKTMTLMAALDSGAIGLSDPIFYNDPKDHPYPEHLQAVGPITIGSGDDSQTLPGTISNITGYTHNFPVTLAYGFSHSDNIIFAEAGIKVGATNWLQYNKNLYVGQQIPFDLPVKVSTVTPQPQGGLCASTPPKQADTLNVRNLAANSFGQGVDFVTPLQMSLIDNVAANDGKLMRPAVIQKIVDPQTKTTLQAFSPTLLRQVISANAAQQVRDAMYGVTACGSGSLSAVQLSYPYTPWAVIGKTGTAQVPQTDPNKVTPGDSWFITAAPYTYQSNAIPALTITAMKENGGEGAYANGPMLRDIYAGIFKDVKTNVQTPPPPAANFCVANNFLQA
ncbi:MAG TPA: penicillin-binding transpeptidase domain-containing protein [Ktedonobacteraceae bacterium]